MYTTNISSQQQLLNSYLDVDSPTELINWTFGTSAEQAPFPVGGFQKKNKEDNNNYFVRHSKQEMHAYNRELAECDGWDECDMIYEENWKGEYHEVMFGPFDKTKAVSIFEKIKNINNLQYSITQGEWEETSSIHGKNGIKRTTGSNYHDEGYYYEYLSIENPLEQATNMSVDEWLEKMDMTECLDNDPFSGDESSSSDEEETNIQKKKPVKKRTPEKEKEFHDSIINARKQASKNYHNASK